MASDPTLLLQDFLSPPSPSYPPSLLARQLSLHLAASPLSPSSSQLPLLSLLVRYTALSPALWDSPPAPSDAQPDQPETLRVVYDAVRNGLLMRLEELTRPRMSTGTLKSSSSSTSAPGWAARRDLHAFLKALEDGLFADPPSSLSSPASEGIRPLVRVALSSAILSALQEWKRRKEKLWVGGGKGLEGWEEKTGRSWGQWAAAGGAAGEAGGFATWCAAQTLPGIQAEVLAKHFPVAALLRSLTDSFSLAFAGGNAFSSPPLSADLVDTPEGLSWTVPSRSHTYLTALTASPLFPILGSLSRAIGRTTEAAAILARSPSPWSPAALSSIQHLSSTLLTVSSSLSTGWSSAPWSDLLLDTSLSPSTRTQTAPWTLLKSLLFSQTLIFSSLLQFVATPANEGDEPTPLQRQLATDAVLALGRTYFVALRFGQSGFPAWMAVLAGLVEVVAAPHKGVKAKGEASPAEVLVRSLEPEKGRGKGGRHDRAVERAEATFWMNMVEQVMRELGDEYVESRVLRGIRPYLDDAEYRDPFEAAHSVMLAFFAANQRSAIEVAPWYTELILRTHPSLLSPTQFRLAYSTLVAAVSSSDDALAWWCIEELLAAIDKLPVATPPVETSSSSSLLSGLGNDDSAPLTSSSGPSSITSTAVTSPSAAPPPPAFPLSPLDGRASSLPRGIHLLTLTSLLPSVSLRLLPRLLTSIETLIWEEPLGSDGRRAIVEYAFERIGEGMDAVKRGEGTRWWMEKGEGLERGGPVREEAVVVEEREEEKEEREEQVKAEL
ncbi:hypothetical protein JCM8547_004212 [Rhodosporidiobolus lusitaniae]